MLSKATHPLICLLYTSPQEEYTLIIRQYSTGITRLFLGFGEYELTDRSEMLQFSERIRKVPLSVEKQEGKWVLSTEDGTKRAVINVEPPVLDRWSELLQMCIRDRNWRQLTVG